MSAQHFFIRKNSTLPLLLMKVINDGRTDYKNLFTRLENAAVTFSMIDPDNGVYKVFNKQGLIIPVDDNCCGEIEYYLGYKFSSKDTNLVGTYKGEFKVDFLDNSDSLIVPIRTDLMISVVDSFTTTKIVC